MLIDQVISFLDALEVLIEALLPSLVHLVLQVKVSDMFSSLLPGECCALLLLFMHLRLDHIQLHAPFLLRNSLLMLRPSTIHMTVVL